MGWEVKNPLRAQSKYGLMGSSAKTGKKIFRGSPEHFLDKNAIWDRTPSHLHINCSLHVWGRAQGSQIFKQNSIISIRSKVMAFLVILLSPRGPRHPRVVPVFSTSSPRCPRHPHVIPVVPRRSPCGLHGLWSPHVVSVVPTSSPSSREGPHVVSMVCGLHMLSPLSPSSPCHPPSSPHHLEGPHIIPNPPDTHSTHPHPPGGWGPRISKNAIRFELIKIF